MGILEGNGKVLVRLDAITSLANKAADVTRFMVNMPTVPMAGEIINFPDGNPYVVVSRAWAVGHKGGLYAYLRCMPAPGVEIDYQSEDVKCTSE